MTHNYEEKLSAEIITGNYELVFYVAQKCVNYRDTGVSKKEYVSLYNICTLCSLTGYILSSEKKNMISQK